MKKSIQFLVALLLVATGGNAQYKSLLWKITGHDLKEPSYLYGTMHTADARIVKLGDSLSQPYFNNAKTYAMEIDMGNTGMNMNLFSKLMMGKGYSLAKMMPDKEYKFLDSIAAAKMGYPLALFDNVAPILVMTIFQSISMGLTDSSIDGDAQVLDVYFYKKAKNEAKKVVGIETVDEQLNALAVLSYQDQADLLVQEIDSFNVNQSQGKDLVRYYLNQDLDSLSMLDDDAQKPEKFYKALVLDRNVRMADRIPGIIKKQSTFIAIGAMHLPGKSGVIELLRAKGYTVEPAVAGK